MIIIHAAWLGVLSTQKVSAAPHTEARMPHHRVPVDYLVSLSSCRLHICLQSLEIYSTMASASVHTCVADMTEM